MSEISKRIASRRGFLRTTGRVTAASALAAAAIPHVHAAENNTIQEVWLTVLVLTRK